MGEKVTSFNILKNLTKHNNKFIRIISIYGLAYIGNQESIKIIDEMRDDADNKVHVTANLVYNKIKL
ncbi:MAG: hypothetical protein ACFFG0_32470 [Candidatus Thorarchaeota archaeon]